MSTDDSRRAVLNRAEEFPAPAAPAPKEKKRLPSPKVRKAIELLDSGRCRTVTAAAEAVGLTREHLSTALGKPHIKAWHREKRERAVLLSSGRASERIGELLDCDSHKVCLDAAKHLLSIDGIKPAPAATNLSINTAVGYVILLGPRSGGTAAPEDVIIGGELPAPAASHE
jgi:hypothetical protein